RPSDVLRFIVRQGVGLSAVGAALGILGALGATRYLASLLYGVRPFDPVTFLSVALLLGLVALAACYIPARRAMHVDPMVALRHERSEEHTSELQSLRHLVCRLLLEKKKILQHHVGPQSGCDSRR